MEVTFTPDHPAYPYVVGTFALLLALELLRSTQRLLLGRASLGWIAVQARIDDVSIARAEPDDHRQRFSPYVRYSFRRGGVLYRGRHYSFKWVPSYNYGEAAKRVQGMGRGSQVLVYCNPRNPHQSVLVPGVTRDNYIAPVIESGVLACLLWLLFRAF